MSDNANSFLYSSSSQHQPSFYWAVFFVVAMHLGLLGLSKHWNSAPAKPKEKQKVVVQTIRLDQPRSTSAPARRAASSPASVAPTKPIPPAQDIPAAEIPKPVEPIPEELTMREDIPAPVEEVIENKPTEKEVEQEKEIPIKQKAPSPPTPATKPKPAPAPAKKDSKPKTTPPKPAAKEIKKPEVKSPAPVKKAPEPVKKTPKKETPKKSEKSEVDKKAQKEKIDADKKRQQEKTDADKKKQKEKAEADKKRQQEIAAAEEVVRQKERVLLSKAQENLAKMGQTRDKISSSPSTSLATTALPKELGTLQVDALPIDGPGEAGNWGTKEVSYSGEVASRPKKALRLPDYGAVKIKLTLDRTGKVIKVEIDQSESSKNKAYVESKIPSLLFPPFGQRFSDTTQHTFVITLENDS